MAKKMELNGRAKLIIVALAILTVLYNTIATHVILKNDVKHLGVRIERTEDKVDALYGYMIKP